MGVIDVALPANEWYPRDHQLALWDYLRLGGKRAIAVWHRRAGKDEVALHHAAMSLSKRVGNHWHCLPEFEQGRKALWNSVNAHTGKRRIDEAFPLSLRKSTNETEMLIKFLNGSTWQVVGSDRYDAMVGAGPVGIVFSEFALANPSAWGYFRPMLEENDGWALFISTPRGHNHCKAMFDHAKQSGEWFAELLTVKDTGALTPAQLREALKEMRALYGLDVGSALYRQEFFCDFTAAILGAFYALECAAVRNENRILEIEPDLTRPIHTAWDLGVGDDTAIWWWQAHASGQYLILDHFSASGVGLESYRDQVFKRERERGWLRGNDYVPHDAKVKEWGSGKTRVETMQAMGLHPALIPLTSIDDGINAVRRVLPLCVFHPRCDEGFTALEQYRREWDDERKCFKAAAMRDWTTDRADAFRYLALAAKPAPLRIVKSAIEEGWRIPPPELVAPRRGLFAGMGRLHHG